MLTAREIALGVERELRSVEAEEAFELAYWREQLGTGMSGMTLSQYQLLYGCYALDIAVEVESMIPSHKSRPEVAT